MATTHRAKESAAPWEDLDQVFDELFSASAEFEQTAARQLDDCDVLRLELEGRCRQLADQQQQAQRARDELDVKWQKLEELRQITELGAKQVQDEARRLFQWHARLSTLPAVAPASEGAPAPEVAQAPAGLLLTPLVLPDLNAALADAQAQIGRLVASAEEVAGLRQQFLEAKAEVNRLRHRLAREKGRLGPNLQQQVDSLLKERQRLQADLDAAREQMNEQQQAERAAWLAEVQALRKSLDEFAETTRRQRQGRNHANRNGATTGDGQASLARLIDQFDQLQDQLHASLGSRPPG
ncbi:MAG: hypothetical protein JSS27_08755 [Planctomycetes bacterium]|nr:hypothetical protein [Planctomycetota bacterium]